MKVGLFFGSFNPVHIGHLIIANSVAQSDWVDEVWMVVSPQNPFKKKSSLLHEQDRIEMVRIAIAYNNKLKASDIEFKLPKPSYTIDTLTYLKEKYPHHDFKVIMGGDNLTHFPKWKNAQMILDEYGLLVYPRPNTAPSDLEQHPNVQLVDAPKVELSATYIRKAIKAGQSIQYLVHPDVENYIKLKKFYQE